MVAGRMVLGFMTKLDPKPPSRLAPQQNRSRETRARILAAADTLLRAQGVDGFSIGGIASLAGIPIGNIYRRFEGKDDILQALKDAVANRIAAAVSSAVKTQSDRDLQSYVEGFADAVIGVFSSDEELHRALFDPRVASPKMLETGQNARSTIYSQFSSGLSTHLAGLEGEAAETAAKVVFSIITNAALTKVRGQDPIMRHFAWDEVRRQYSLAAIAYLRELQSARPPSGVPR
jgi:AcrR family transcriptional regulator